MHISLTLEFENEKLVQAMKLELLKHRLATGAEQAKQGKFVEQSIGEIITEIKDA